jgi:hypothetical protein
MKAVKEFSACPTNDGAWVIANGQNTPGRIRIHDPAPNDGTATWRAFANAIHAACDYIDEPEPPIVLTVELSEEDVREVAGWLIGGPTRNAIIAAARAAVAKLDGEGGGE